MRITQVLRVKGDDVVTISPEASVRDLVGLLSEHNIGAVVVSTGDRVVSGIVSERDIVRGLVSGADVLEAKVSDIMTPDVRSAGLGDSVDDLMKLMTEHRIRHVPVLADGELRGIVSIGDLVKSRIGELEFERDQLEHYVAGSQ